MKVALIHDYLNQLGGAERVVAVLHEMYPEAPIHTLFVDRNRLWPSLQDANIVPSFLQRFPFVMRHFKLFFWLYPFVIKNLKVPDCDIVISSSSAYAKGTRLRKRFSRRQGAKQPLHICYCHTPMRFAWDFDRYIANETGNKWLARGARLFVPLLKRWDRHSARNVDLFIANSSVVRARIKALYGRDSTVIHPPVEFREVPTSATDESGESSATHEKPGGHFLIVSRLVSYKRLDIAIEAFNQLGQPLVVIGRGPDRDRLESLAGPTVRFLGFQSEEEVIRQMATCKALIFPGEEDFGITPLEANSFGRPVIAYGAGGALDTVRDGVNGLFFDDQSAAALAAAIQRFDTVNWQPQQIRAAALRFERSVFEQHIRRFVAEAMDGRDTVPERLVFVTEGRVSG